MNTPKFYADTFDPEKQVDMEEKIAAYLFDGGYINSEETANRIGREVLKLVLAEFRPDLFMSDIRKRKRLKRKRLKIS